MRFWSSKKKGSNSPEFLQINRSRLGVGGKKRLGRVARGKLASLGVAAAIGSAALLGGSQKLAFDKAVVERQRALVKMEVESPRAWALRLTSPVFPRSIRPLTVRDVAAMKEITKIARDLVSQSKRSVDSSDLRQVMQTISELSEELAGYRGTLSEWLDQKRFDSRFGNSNWSEELRIMESFTDLPAQKQAAVLTFIRKH